MTLEAPITVVSAPVLEPDTARQIDQVPPGLTVLEIVLQFAPGLAAHPEHLRVSLAIDDRVWIISCEHWRSTRPRPGVRVIIRAVPGKDAVRAVLVAVVAVAATVFAPGLATALLPGIAPAIGTALVATGLTVLGNLLINALIPIEQPRANSLEREQRYALDGWRNDRRPGAPDTTFISCATPRQTSCGTR